jgi:hypothetical protein
VDQEGLLVREHERVVLLDVGEALYARYVDLLPREGLCSSHSSSSRRRRKMKRMRRRSESTPVVNVVP